LWFWSAVSYQPLIRKGMVIGRPFPVLAAIFTELGTEKWILGKIYGHGGAENWFSYHENQNVKNIFVIRERNFSKPLFSGCFGGSRF